MPDWHHSTLPQAQAALVAVVGELQQLDERLGALTEAIALAPDKILPAELQAGVGCVRTDLLSDAISTLSALAVLNEEAAVRKRIEVADIVDRIAAFG